MSTPTPTDDVPVRRIDRILAFISLGLLILSVACFLAIMIATATGSDHEDFGTGIWPVVGVIVYIAPPLAFVAMVALIIMAFTRRARANRGN
ncbi:multidrug ABC transporter ATPase [Microbacterium sp. cx-55]|uniref:multidrug ABC transporter ATPase n=1 Tax=unclassified Microbacterium TaxID=2609290 RepID=UPI001CC049B3|nr:MULTISPECIES: multidrug ABC transporter ATPase [unclassified Microbacterium]MBZ4488165.1 multidrug ABC transporter ATPase [Microbacterium sp. cx-55]MCC4908831.1 multidrug ABC transporter ATPase [Microbacterium sp. cx-59]UGB34428.1 multidrug ABC transporter ATPase [Microbacterium sp. cx-55]